MSDSILVCICSRDGDGFDAKAREIKKQICDTIGVPVEFEIVPNNGKFGLTSVYNHALNTHDNRFVVFTHDDVVFNTINWGSKLIELFEKYKEYGIIGVAGSASLGNNAIWWQTGESCRGEVVHDYKKEGAMSVMTLSKFSPNDNELDEVCCLDGVFFAVDRTRCDERFDDITFNGFHFYDVSYTFGAFAKKVCKVGVTKNFRITHKSIGNSNTTEYNNYRLAFIELYRDYLPVTNLISKRDV